MPAKTDVKKPVVDAMFNAGAHYGFIKSRRHPTVKPFIFGSKNKIEIFDLEKTEAQLEAAIEFVKKLAASGKQLVFVGSKSEAKQAIKEAAERIGQPNVPGRWIGGTLTNFDNIRKRVEKLLDLSNKREKGELGMYTKKERLMIDREIERLTGLFGGITGLSTLPGAVFVADPKKEHIVVAEARERNIPVIALAGSDCDVSVLNYPIVANDSAIASIKFFTDKIADAYAEGKRLGAEAVANPKKE
jgi:small subunit ribosomal protein S2